MDLMTLMASVAGVVLSLVFAYVPGASNWFDGLEGNGKRLVMLALLLTIALMLAGLACFGFAKDVSLELTCDRPGIVELVKAFIAATIGNQSAFLISPKKKAKAIPVYEDLK